MNLSIDPKKLKVLPSIRIFITRENGTCLENRYLMINQPDKSQSDSQIMCLRKLEVELRRRVIR